MIAPHARMAFVDESLSNEIRDPNTYILAAAICDEPALEDARATVASLRLKHQVKVHWHDEDDKRRVLIAETIAFSPVRHVVVVRSGRPGSTLSASARNAWSGCSTNFRRATSLG